MKKWFHKCLFAVVATTMLASCEKDEIKAVLNSGAVPVVAVSSQTVVLTKENADKEALTVSWAKPDYGFDAPANYTILIEDVYKRQRLPLA